MFDEVVAQTIEVETVPRRDTKSNLLAVTVQADKRILVFCSRVDLMDQLQELDSRENSFDESQIPASVDTPKAVIADELSLESDSRGGSHQMLRLQCDDGELLVHFSDALAMDFKERVVALAFGGQPEVTRSMALS